MVTRTRLMKTFPAGKGLASDRLTRHHVVAEARGGRWEPGNILFLREGRHAAYHNLFGERSFVEAASIVDALVSALAREEKFSVALVRCKRRWERIKFERGYRGPLQCLVFWGDKREAYQRFFRRERPSVRDAAAFRRALRILERRALVAKEGRERREQSGRRFVESLSAVAS